MLVAEQCIGKGDLETVTGDRMSAARASSFPIFFFKQRAARRKNILHPY